MKIPSEFKYVEFIDDVRANAIGYEKLTAARLRRGGVGGAVHGTDKGRADFQ